MTRRLGRILRLGDLDELNTKDDICEALRVELNAEVKVLAVKIIPRMYWATQTAAVRLSMNIARKPLEKRRERVECVNYLVRKKLHLRKC